MFGGPWDSTLIMTGVLSLKMGVPSFIYGPSMKEFKQALVVKHVSHNIKSFSYLNDNGQPFVSTLPAIQLDRNFRFFSGLVFEMIRTYLTPNSP